MHFTVKAKSVATMNQLEDKAGLLKAAPVAASGYLQLRRKPKLRVSKWILYPMHFLALLFFIWCMLRVEQDLVEKGYIKPIFRSDVEHAANKILDFDEAGPLECNN